MRVLIIDDEPLAQVALANVLSNRQDIDARLFDFMRDVLTQPRFQDDKIALRKDQLLQEMKQRNDDSSAIEGREFTKRKMPV